MTSAATAVLGLLHGFSLDIDHQPVRVPLPGQRLLAFLSLQRRAVTRAATAAALWPDLSDGGAASRLRSALWRLPQASSARLVATADRSLTLEPEVVVDLHEAERTPAWTHEHLAAWRGDLLDGWDDEWLLADRERFRQLRLHRLEDAAAQACRTGQYGLALQAALAAVASDPLRESAHRAVMAVHLAEQNPAEALRQYDVVRRRLRHDLGLSPSPATRAMVQPLLGRPADAVG